MLMSLQLVVVVVETGGSAFVPPPSLAVSLSPGLFQYNWQKDAHFIFFDTVAKCLGLC